MFRIFYGVSAANEPRDMALSDLNFWKMFYTKSQFCIENVLAIKINFAQTVMSAVLTQSYVKQFVCIISESLIMLMAPDIPTRAVMCT